VQTLRGPAEVQFLRDGNEIAKTSISVSPDGETVAVVERIANNIDTFHVNADGTLAAVVVNPSPGAGAFSGRFAPDGKLIVSETGPASEPARSAFSSYTVLENGSLATVSQSVPTEGAANRWNAITPDGLHVYVSNAGSSNISGFTIGAAGTLTPIAGTIVRSNPDGSTNLDIAISGDGKFLYSLNGEVGTVGVFTVLPNGNLEEVTQIPGLPAAAGFNGIAALLSEAAGSGLRPGTRSASSFAVVLFVATRLLTQRHHRKPSGGGSKHWNYVEHSSNEETLLTLVIS
jgi:6-phosphogluconolactonase (cycloisomerase 2 family)